MDAAGGGGCGDPLERDPDLVAADVMDGYVSVDRAREDYGVVIDPESMAVDREATAELGASAVRAGWGAVVELPRGGTTYRVGLAVIDEDIVVAVCIFGNEIGSRGLVHHVSSVRADGRRPAIIICLCAVARDAHKLV